MNFEARLRRIEKEIQKKEMEVREMEEREHYDDTIGLEKAFRDLHTIYGNGAPYVPPPPGLTTDAWNKLSEEILHEIFLEPLEKTDQEKPEDTKPV